jgi:hypothetical protein
MDQTLNHGGYRQQGGSTRSRASIAAPRAVLAALSPLAVWKGAAEWKPNYAAAMPTLKV